MHADTSCFSVLQVLLVVCLKMYLPAQRIVVHQRTRLHTDSALGGRVDSYTNETRLPVATLLLWV